MPTELLPDVYDVTTREDDNGRRYRAYLFDGPAPTLVDTCWPDSTDHLLEGVAATGLAPERLVLTHGHPDHVGGVDAVVERYGVETWAPEGTDLDGSVGAGVAVEHDPDWRYGHGDRVGPFEAVHVPGHAPDQHALVDEDRGLVVTGDALSGADLRGFPEGYLLPHAAVFGEDMRAAELNLERLLDYEFEAALVSHGTAVLEGARERLEAYVNFPGRPASPP